MIVYALDLDLDFFLSNPCEMAEIGKRPAPEEARPWSEQAFREFLEGRCGLSRKRKIPGAVFETHDGALDFWASRGEFPLRVTHVDAHSDLGIGRPGPAFVLESVVTRPAEDRVAVETYREQKKLDEANYLLFALAFRWIARLENVRNPASRPDMPDFCRLAEQRDGVRRGTILLESSVGRLIPTLNRHESAVPYTVYDDWTEFRADAPYDIATLAISPRYAPATADFLAEAFRDYVL